MAVEDMKGLFPKLRKRAVQNAMSSVEVGEDMRRAGQPGGGLTDAQAEAMTEGKPLPKRTPPKKPNIDPGIRSLKEMTDREIRGELPINRVTKSTSDVVTVPNAFTDTKGVTYYQPEGDPFQYEYNATDKSFKAKKDGQVVVTVKPGDPAYEEFLTHAQGGKTRYYGGKAAAPKAPAAEVEAESTVDVDEFGYPIDSATPPEQMETSAVEVSEPPMSPDDPNQLPPMSMDEPEAPAATPSPPTSKQMREKAASTAISRDKQLADFRRTATTEQDDQLRRAQAAYRTDAMGMGRSVAVAQVKAAMQDAADAEGSGYQVTDDDAIYLLENY